ncbi:MAG: cysteine desulfurase [Candidatus Pacebacteria bacterium]|nr:cysteine desulfurase [Candidatus Paceibacterota bacterium]
MKNFFRKKRIYMDYAAATPLDRRVERAMRPYWSERFGNPGGLHQEGRIAKEAVVEARTAIAHTLHVRPEEVVFTGSGTEGNSLALIGYMYALKERSELKGAHMIVSALEHPSVRDCFSFFEEMGVEVDFIDGDEQGIIRPEQVRKFLRKETRLVSVGYVNNEIGTVQPIKEIAREIRAFEKKEDVSIVFHTDASQAPLYFNCTPEYLGVDLETFDGQKIYGPKGVGCLYKSNKVTLSPIMRGGSQEYGLRPGTENVPLIVGMKEALIRAAADYIHESKEIGELQEYFFALLEKEIPRSIVNGTRAHRSPSNVNISIPGIDNEYLAVALDEHGVAVATKSACIGHGTGKHSYVVASLSGDVERAESAVRFSLGRGVRKRDIDRVVAILKAEVAKIDRLKL